MLSELRDVAAHLYPRKATKGREAAAAGFGASQQKPTAEPLQRGHVAQHSDWLETSVFVTGDAGI